MKLTKLTKLTNRELGIRSSFDNFKEYVYTDDETNLDNCILKLKTAQCEDLESPFYAKESVARIDDTWKNRTAAMYLFSEYNGVGPFDIVYFKRRICYHVADAERVSRIKLNRTGDFFNFLNIQCPGANINKLEFSYEHPYVDMGIIEFPPLKQLYFGNIFIPAPMNGHIYTILKITWDRELAPGDIVQIVVNYGITKNASLRTKTVVGPISFNFLNRRYYFSQELTTPIFKITDLNVSK